jgi:hypothetical protein
MPKSCSKKATEVVTPAELNTAKQHTQQLSMQLESIVLQK